MRRLHHPAIQRHSVADIKLEKFGGSVDKRRSIRAKRRVIFQNPRRTVRRKFHQVSDRGDVGSGILVESPVGIGRNIVIVRTRRSGWTYALRNSGLIEPRAIKVTLRGILGRRAEIKPAALFVGAAKADHIEIPVRDQLHACCRREKPDTRAASRPAR